MKFKYENVVWLAFQRTFYSKTRLDGHITIREKSVWRKGRWFLCFLCLLGMSTNLFQPYSRIFTALFAIYLYENQFSLDVVTDIAKVVSMKRLEGTLFQQASDGSTGNAWIRLVNLSFYPGNAWQQNNHARWWTTQYDKESKKTYALWNATCTTLIIPAQDETFVMS